MDAVHNISSGFSDQVQSLRQYVHEALGWSYSAGGASPPILQPLLANRMIFSRTRQFDFRGSVMGQAFAKQAFELDDITAVTPPTPHMKNADQMVIDKYAISSFGKAVTDEADGFQGVVLSLDHHTRFLGKTIIRRDKRHFNPSYVNGLKRVGFASLEFERLFEVYSDDQVEARALLTPDFMARLIDFNEDYMGRNVQCVFLGDKVHVCLDIDDRFDFSEDFKAMAYEDAATRITHEIGAIFYLLEKVQALQARIGRIGADGAEAQRRDYYKALLESLRPAVLAAQGKFKSPQKDISQSFASMERWQHLLLQPRI